MREIQELLDRILPFVVLPYEGLGDKSASVDCQYLHELKFDQFSLEKIGEEVLNDC